MKKPYTAHKLIKEITELCESHQVDPKNVVIHFRSDRDSYVRTIHQVEEDLYNADDNSTLESIVMFEDPKHR